MKMNTSILLGGLMAALTLFLATPASAQGRFDPAEFRQRMMDNLKEKMDMKDDKEWDAIEPLVGKVMDAQREVITTRGGGMMRGGMSGGRRNRDGNSSTNSTTSGGASNNRPRGGGFGEPSAASKALQDAIDKNAPAAEIKTKLAAVRAEIKDKEAKLEAAQEDLKGVLTPKQEAVAVLAGLLK